MRITALELPATWGDPMRALDEVTDRIARGAPGDLVLLPEAALTGYVSPERDFDLSRFDEALEGPTAKRCAAIARTYRTHLVAPLILEEDRARYNAMVCFDPRGERMFVYRKRHPWVPETWATAGKQPMPVVQICDRAVTIAICYDLHFLSSDSITELASSDILLFPSAWVERPDTRVERLSRVARRFDIHVVNANWAPGVVRVPGQGGSCVIAPDGQVIETAPPGGRIDVEI